MTLETQTAVLQIIKALQSSDNEATDSPWWMLVDPAPLKSVVCAWEDPETGEKQSPDLEDPHMMERLERVIPNCIQGPFFSRADAENYLKARHYEYSKSAYVYCTSGYWSRKYKDLCRTLNFPPYKKTANPEDT